LEDCEIEAKRLKTILYDSSSNEEQLKEYIDIIEHKIDSFVFKGKSMSRKFALSSDRKPSIEDDLRKVVVKLNGRLIIAQRQLIACSHRWINLLETVNYLEVILSLFSQSICKDNICL
jgi:hypothetical protein